MPVVGLSDLNNNNSSQRKEEEDEKRRNELYTGGNRRGGGGSGLSVIGPTDDDDEDEEADEGEESSSNNDNSSSHVVGDIFSRAQQADGAPSVADKEVPKRVITMYANGFVIDDGPFRSLTDPANEPFLRDVSRGVVPRELEDSAQESGSFHLELVDRRRDQYVPPAYVAFSGGGQTLGTTPTDEEKTQKTEEVKEEKPEVNGDEPTTTLQVRLPGGRRIVVTLNLTHTVGHVHAYVQSQTNEQRSFVLMAGFPPKTLSDSSATIKDANLAGASLTQKFL